MGNGSNKEEWKNKSSWIKNGWKVFLLNKSVTPAENASILVAIANKNKHNKLMHKGFDDFLSKASLINFIPKKTKMVKTIYLAYGAM